MQDTDQKNVKISLASHKKIKTISLEADCLITEAAEAALNVAFRHREELIAEVMLLHAKARQKA